jgi:hypothetical protein
MLCLLVNLLLLEAPSGVISYDFWVGLGPLSVLFLQIVVLFRVVLPRRVAAPVILGAGKCCHHGFQLHWSRVSHGVFVIGISSVLGGYSITSVCTLVVYFQLLLFPCSLLLVLVASLSAQIFCEKSIPTNRAGGRGWPGFQKVPLAASESNHICLCLWPFGL